MIIANVLCLNKRNEKRKHILCQIKKQKRGSICIKRETCESLTCKYEDRCDFIIVMKGKVKLNIE
ncbi:hypothetical protein WN48_05485 [Eufriesea mexicana]|uniref:Uncharacterized protein n=1 Tax=Eufriesea mexicana TaxID=516756 RepID=A0A310SHN0_9HYME|nr:hypothetical protein WN48_05485 [Eufriesea mexicana]